MIAFLIIVIAIVLFVLDKEMIAEARIQYFLQKYPNRYYIDNDSKKLVKQDYSYQKRLYSKYIKPRLYNRRILRANKLDK